MCCAESNDFNGAVYGIRPTCVSQHKKGTKEQGEMFKGVGTRQGLGGGAFSQFWPHLILDMARQGKTDRELRNNRALDRMAITKTGGEG
jgi:hypothetical protein